MRFALAVTAIAGIFLIARPYGVQGQVGVPSPANSYIDPCLVICPFGDIFFNVIVRDFSNFPISGAVVRIGFTDCPEVVLCDPLSDDGYDIRPGPAVEALTGANGAVGFGIRGGGVCDTEEVTIRANGVLLALRYVASPDQDGNLQVDAADQTVLANKQLSNPSDPSGDLSCDGSIGTKDFDILEDHQLHTCPAAPVGLRLQFTDLTIRPIIPGPATFNICVTATNISADPTPPAPFKYRFASFGAFLPWSDGVDLIIPALAPGESQIICIQAENHCSYQGCPANEFCEPACNNGSGEFLTSGATQGPVLPPPPSGVFPCPPGGWGGNVDVFFEGEQQIVLHTFDPIPASIGHPTYVHVCVGDNTGDVYDWLGVAEATCSGWDIKFVAEDANGQPLPGVPMPDPIQNAACGFICVTPNPNGPGPCPTNLQFENLAGEIVVVEFRFDSSPCAPTPAEGTTWGKIKAGYR